MAKTETMAIPVTFNFRESLAEELRAAADLLDPRPPSTTAEDLRGADAEIERLLAIIRGDIPDAEAEATVERVARALHGLGHPDGCYCGALGWEMWASDARAVLDALAGKSRA